MRTNKQAPSPQAQDDQRQRIGDRVSIFRVPNSPNWYMGYSEGKQQIRRSLRTRNKKRAVELARKKEAELVLGISNRSRWSEISITDAADQYISSRRLADCDPGTLDNYRRDLVQFAAYARLQGTVRLAAVDALLLEQYQTRLQARGMKGVVGQSKLGRRLGPNKPKTIRNKLKTARQLLKWATRRKLLTEDPATGYQLPPEPKHQAHCWTPQELRLIRENAEQPWLDVFDFLSMTGLRSDELCWLLIDDILREPQPHLLIRRKACPQTGKIWHAKHGRDRNVPLCPAAADIAQRTAAASPGPWLFWSRDARGPQLGHLKPDAVWRALRRTLQKAGIKRGTVHTFRHFFCSFAANNNVTPFKVMTILGHGSLEIVLRYYHLDQDELLHSLDHLPFFQLQAGNAKGGDLAEI